LVGLIGLILIYGFFNQNVRRYSMAIAATSKMVFVVLVARYGEAFYSQVAAAIAMDVVVIVVAVVYLFSPRVNLKTAD